MQREFTPSLAHTLYIMVVLNWSLISRGRRQKFSNGRRTQAFNNFQNTTNYTSCEPKIVSWKEREEKLIILKCNFIYKFYHN